MRRALLPVLLLALAAGLSGCGKSKSQVTLPPELLGVRCPSGKTAHAAGAFAGARVTFLCIGQEIADSPHLLRCDLESRPMICEDEGSFTYSATQEGTIHAGMPQGKGAPDFGGGSRLTVNFRKGPPRTATFDEAETDWRFVTEDGKRFLPAGFTLVKGTVCDRAATVLGSGVCNLEARSASLYWHIAVHVNRPRGMEISREEYRGELEFWLKHLGRLVTDPAK